MAEREQLLMASQVNEVLEFSQALYAMDNYGYYNPWLQNTFASEP